MKGKDSNQRLFLDTNIMLDLLGERHPFYEPIAKVATLADMGKVNLVVSSLSYATVNYFLAKYESNQAAIEKLRKFKIISEIVALDEVIIDKGLHSNFNDFEDSLQFYSAIEARCNVLLSRNGRDFKYSSIPVLTAEEYLKSTIMP